jgi:hypothetical protein
VVVDKHDWTEQDREHESGECYACGHLMSQHDPEDGSCDAPLTAPPFGVCPCGRQTKEPQKVIDLLSADELRNALEQTRKAYDEQVDSLRKEIEWLRVMAGLIPPPDGAEDKLLESVFDENICDGCNKPIDAHEEDCPFGEIQRLRAALEGAFDEINAGSRIAAAHIISAALAQKGGA